MFDHSSRYRGIKEHRCCVCNCCLSRTGQLGTITSIAGTAGHAAGPGRTAEDMGTAGHAASPGRIAEDTGATGMGLFHILATAQHIQQAWVLSWVLSALRQKPTVSVSNTCR